MKLGALAVLAVVALMLGPSEGRNPQRFRFVPAQGEFSLPSSAHRNMHITAHLFSYNMLRRSPPVRFSQIQILFLVRTQMSSKLHHG